MKLLDGLQFGSCVALALFAVWHGFQEEWARAAYCAAFASLIRPA